MTYAWFDVTRNAGIARIMHMSYRSKTYRWKDVILVKRSMIRVFLSPYVTHTFIQLFPSLYPYLPPNYLAFITPYPANVEYRVSS